MKVRLILRKSRADAEGKCVGYDYVTTLVRELPNYVSVGENAFSIEGFEVIGGEWKPDEVPE